MITDALLLRNATMHLGGGNSGDYSQYINTVPVGGIFRTSFPISDPRVCCYNSVYKVKDYFPYVTGYVEADSLGGTDIGRIVCCSRDYIILVNITTIVVLRVKDGKVFETKGFAEAGYTSFCMYGNNLYQSTTVGPDRFIVRKSTIVDSEGTVKVEDAGYLYCDTSDVYRFENANLVKFNTDGNYFYFSVLEDFSRFRLFTCPVNGTDDAGTLAKAVMFEDCCELTLNYYPYTRIIVGKDLDRLGKRIMIGDFNHTGFTTGPVEYTGLTIDKSNPSNVVADCIDGTVMYISGYTINRYVTPQLYVTSMHNGLEYNSNRKRIQDEYGISYGGVHIGNSKVNYLVYGLSKGSFTPDAICHKYIFHNNILYDMTLETFHPYLVLNDEDYSTYIKVKE